MIRIDLVRAGMPIRLALRVSSNPNPVGDGLIIKHHNAVWVLVGGLLFSLNARSKALTPSVPWPREMPEVWRKTGLNLFYAAMQLEEMNEEANQNGA